MGKGLGMLYYSTEFWDTQNRGEALEVSVRSRWYVYREKSLKADWWAKGLTGMSGRFAGLGHGPERSGRVMNQGLGEIHYTGREEGTARLRPRMERGWYVCSAMPGWQGQCG